MAKSILEHEACNRQSHSKLLETLVLKLTDSGNFDLNFQDNTFSLTFTAPDWYLYWRLLHVGCTLADHALNLIPDSTPVDRTKAAHLWNILSNALSDLLENGEVIYERKRSLKKTR